MTKLEIIEEHLDREDQSPAEIARLLRLTKPALLAEFKRRAKNEAAARRAWENRRCKCGKLNKNCGDLFHAIEMIEPWPTPFATVAKGESSNVGPLLAEIYRETPKKKMLAPGIVHSWGEEEKKP